MSQIVFMPFGFPPSDRDALMNFDRTVCEMLEPGDRFARPCMAWEISAVVPEREKYNVTIVRKITDEMRTRRYVQIEGLDLTKPRILDLGSEEYSCLLCGAPAGCTAFYVSDEMK
jgi:hypothetical protein